MAVSITWGTKVIYVPKADLTLVSGTLYSYDVNAFRLELKSLEDDSDGMAFERTHNHNTEVIISGTTYARTVEIINGYTVEFEDGQYTVQLTGANHNIADVKVANQVSLIIGNSAGLQTVASGSGLSTAQDDRLRELWQLQGLDENNAMTVTDTDRKVGTVIDLDISDNGTTTTVQRQ